MFYFDTSSPLETSGFLRFLGCIEMEHWREQKQSPKVLLQEKMFLENLQNSQENTCARVSFLKRDFI